MPSRFTNDMFGFIMFSQLFIISIYRDSAVQSDYALGKERLQSGWRKEYLSGHNETEAHKGALAVPLEREAAAKFIHLQGSCKDGIIHLMKDVYFLCSEQLAILKTET